MSMSQILGLGAAAALAVIVAVVIYGLWQTMKIDEKDMD